MLATLRSLPSPHHALLAVAVACAVALDAATLYVTPAGSGDGSSWASATDLRSALDAAAAGDEVWVAVGTYRPATCLSCGASDKAATFAVPSGVAVYGGFAGDETSLEERDPAGRSTLTGQLADGTRVYHVLSFGTAAATTLVDGFDVTGGQATGPGANGSGGGVLVLPAAGATSVPVIANCAVFANSAKQGAGAFVDGSTGTARPTFRGVRFAENTADYGAGVYNSGFGDVASPRFEGCTFVDNEASNYGGGVYNFAKDGGTTAPVYANCVFARNTGQAAAGGMYTLASSGGTAEPIITGAVFYDNFSNVGGAVYVNASGGEALLTFSNSIFSASRAGWDALLHFSGSGTPAVVLDHVQVDQADCSKISFSQTGSLTCGDGMIYDADGGFVDATNGDFRLRENAPGVDAGAPEAYAALDVATDADGRPRVQGGGADLGAYEFGAAAVDPDDRDGDGVLDSLDNCPARANADQLDADADGYGAACDCDDDDDAVNPGGTETCDGRDNDCNGLVDDDAVGDETPPVVVCKDVTLVLPTGGQVGVSPDDVYASGSDNCGEVDATSVSPATFTAAGTYPVTLTVADEAGNTATCTATVTVVAAQEPPTGGELCDARASQPWTEWIAGVSLGEIDNVSGKCFNGCGYGDYTDQRATLATGGSYALAVTPGLSWPGYQPDLYYRVWIDYNGNGSYADAGDLVASADATFAALTADLTVPTTAAIGATTMRVAVRRGEAPEPCGDFVFGEVEDYSVVVEAGGPVAPTLTLTECPASREVIADAADGSAVATFTPPSATSTCAEGAVTVEQIAGPASGRAFPAGVTEVAFAAADPCGNVDTCRFEISVAERSYTVGLSCPADVSLVLEEGESAVAADFDVPTATTDCPGGVEVAQTDGPLPGELLAPGRYEATFAATTGCGQLETCTLAIVVEAATVGDGTYCEVQASQPWTEWIAAVAGPGLDNPSAKCDTKCGYGDFTGGDALALVAGGTAELTLTPGLSWPGYRPDLHWRVWIDWDADGSFLDAGELVIDVQPGNAAVTRAITVPADASAETRMRVAVRRGAPPSPCESYVYGEVEDYAVTVAASAAEALTFRGAVDGLAAYPNPTRGELNFSSGRGIAVLRVRDARGAVVRTEAFSAETFAGTLDLGGIGRGLFILETRTALGETEMLRVVVD